MSFCLFFFWLVEAMKIFNGIQILLTFLVACWLFCFLKRANHRKNESEDFHTSRRKENEERRKKALKR